MTAEERARRKVLEEFQRTALDRIARINALWIGFEQDPEDANTSEELLRELHTLKGESRMMGLSDVSLLMHRMEELAMWSRQLPDGIPPDLGDLVMDASDAAWQLLQQAGATSAPAADLSDLLERFDQRLAGAGEQRAPARAPARTAAQEPAGDRRGPDEDFVRVDVAKVASFSEATFELRVRARRVAQLVRRILGVVSAKSNQLAELQRGTVRTVVSPRRTTGERPGSSPQGVAELVGGLLPLCAGLAHEAEASELLLVELDAQVRNLRLVPIASLFDRYLRVLRDLAREHGKEVTTKIRAAGVHLDKALVDRLAGPLAHLFRNAIDHGIEGAEERAAAGKPRAGGISISAEPRDAMVTLTVADDGRGVDPEGVRERVVELGLVGEEESRAMARADLLQLLFEPGVSTRRAVTETSGRGIGLDAVKREIERLGGHVRLHSDAGKGTAVELQLPVSIALTRVLVVDLEDTRYALPSAAVSAVVSARSEDLEEVHHRVTLRVRDERIPIVGLGTILGRPVAMTDPIRAIIIGENGRRIALAVSRWEGDQDVVVKPLGELLEAARLFAGACLLESGELVLVLNPAMLAAQGLRAERSTAQRMRRLPGAAGQRRKLRILFAEDSAVTRSMILHVLSELGYQVIVARNGNEALELLRDRGADLVLTDLDMPIMNGIELVKQMRSHDAWRAVPAIVLSTRESEADRRRAMDAGADDYLVKGERWEATLREALRRRLEPPS